MKIKAVIDAGTKSANLMEITDIFRFNLFCFIDAVLYYLITIVPTIMDHKHSTSKSVLTLFFSY
jgi:hypothetical protein